MSIVLSYRWRRDPEHLVRKAGLAGRVRSAQEEKRFLDSLDAMPDDELGDLCIVMGGFMDGILGRAYRILPELPSVMQGFEAIAEDLENIAAENPQKTILYAEDGELTYDELNSKANKIANGLIKRGVDIEKRVMFMMRRNSDLIAAVLGIVKAGAAFIPIDPKYPINRINQILDDSDSKFVITSSCSIVA